MNNVLTKKLAVMAIRASLGIAFYCASLSPALALDSTAQVKVEVVSKTQTTWDGKPIQYPQGVAEITSMNIEIAPGGETGWHLHPVPSFAVILQGELAVTLKDGRVNKLKAGDTLVEVVNTLHNGRNTGIVPVKLVVFYAGVAGQANAVKEEVHGK